VKFPLQWKWFAALAVLLVALLLTVYFGISSYLPPYLINQVATNLVRQAQLARAALAPELETSSPDPALINARAHDLARQTGLRVTVIAADGAVLGESDRPPGELTSIENHLYRPEIQEAIREGIGTAMCHSSTVGVDMLYVAAAIHHDGELRGFIRVGLPLHEIAQTTQQVRRIIGLATFTVAVAALPALFWMARRTSRPIEAMRHMAMRVAHGDFSVRAPTQAGGELGELAASLDQMAGQLQTHMNALTQEKAELDATLGNMTEGVLVVDTESKIRLVNRPLQQLFTLPGDIAGRTVLEVFRQPALDEMIARILDGESVSTREMSLLTESDRIFAVNAACLRGSEGSCRGAVIVFHDITRLKQLENLRKEFVANVSHELRTPLSIIKGYVETLLEEHPPDPETSRKFLQTIHKHSQQLEALIGDLLTISALESHRAMPKLESVSLRAAALAVRDELSSQAAARSISISVEIAEDFPAARADATQLHQVFSNLLDNTIKYIQPGGHVIVSARTINSEIEVCVADNGPGIAAEHLPRIFERFYRVDKARSRQLGGTGLGLSIVKHIVQAHGGRVWAESEPGKGSSFFFTLPRA
jgi:two-component system phosphate regulon sensor histidine kinase PhoR